MRYLQHHKSGKHTNDQDHFDQLFERYHSKIYQFCIHYGLSDEDAQEVVQEVFIKFWRKRKSIDYKGNVSAYIYKMARNLIFDEFKRRIKQKAAEDYQIRLFETTQKRHSTQNQVEYNELKNLISETLQSLPDKRKIIFEMSRYEGLSNKDIAKEMGISVKTVEAQLTLALQTFRTVFKKADIISIAILLTIFMS